MALHSAALDAMSCLLQVDGWGREHAHSNHVDHGH